MKKHPIHFLKWLYILSLTLLPMEVAHSVEPWELTLPNNQAFVILFLWLLGFIILGFSLYRVLLKNQVRQGVHPHILSHTLTLLCTGGYLLVLFLYLLDQIGLGWFAVMGSIYLFILLMMVFLGKALRPVILFLVIMLAIIAFRLVDM